MKNELSFKHINKLAIPALLAGIAEPILSATDAAIVGHIDVNATQALAAVGIVGSFLSALIWILGQIRSAISAIISQYLGSNNLDAVKTLPAQAIFLNLVLSLLILISTIFFVKELFSLYNAKGLILEYSISYYNIRVWGFPLTLVTFAVFGIFRGLQNTFWPMVIALIGMAINIVLDLVLVYGVEGLITPMHIEGAAWASLIAQAVMALLSIALLLLKTDVSLRLKFPINPEMYRLIKMAGNLFLRTLALNVALYLANAYATAYGENFIAAQTIAINLWLFSAFFIDGYSSVGNILSGKLLGAKDYKSLWQLSKKITLYALIVAVFLMIIGGFFYEGLGRVFTQESQVLLRFKEVFFIVLLVQPINAIAFVFDAIFKGLGHTAQLRNVLLAATFLGFIPTLLVFDYFDFKLHGIWIAFGVWILFRGSALVFLFRKKYKPLIIH